MSPLKPLKDQLKDWGSKIRTLKKTRPQKFRGTTPLWQIDSEIYNLKRNFRRHHIAYCELRGRKREEIERKVSESNRLYEQDEIKIQKIKEEYTQKIKEYEALYLSTKRSDSTPAGSSSGACVSGISA